MKSFLSLALCLLLSCSCFFSFACGNTQEGGSEHTCVYNEIKFDATNHWNECTCGKTIAKEQHSFTKGKCACGYTDPNYTPPVTPSNPNPNPIIPTPTPTPTPIVEPANYFSKDGTISISMKQLVKFPGIDVNEDGTLDFRVVQGGCTDGTYYYAVLNDGKSDSADSLSYILKFDLSTGEQVAVYKDIKCAHGNDMTYNSLADEIIIVHNKPEKNKVTIYDAKTFTLKNTVELEVEIGTIAFDPYEGCYWIGLSAGYSFAKFDLNFKQISETYEGYNSGRTRQSFDVDSKYIYYLQYNANSIVVMDKQGNFVKDVILTDRPNNEAENICHVGDVFYIGYYNKNQAKSVGGGFIYKSTISVK